MDFYRKNADWWCVLDIFGSAMPCGGVFDGWPVWLDWQVCRFESSIVICGIFITLILLWYMLQTKEGLLPSIGWSKNMEMMLRKVTFKWKACGITHSIPILHEGYVFR